ncbi:DctP family TRAP transporter solute-binding subunit [Caldimonas thermodepolymerans]|jgi:tripartite ATP-independent periplasmic transporter solute receptor, DctP family|uniref:DctP family TRAP transporter solute-binding subunit n=1 Tax=Caldimonas thermodepolymerans TaxID=215580 RepID=UPI00249375EC|nr:DctP family TRAP transporter solute-binding subunit [Caldimonas thermodepolymerans]
MLKRRKMLAAVALAMAGGPALAAGPAAVREFEVADFRSYLPAEHPVRRGLQAFADRVARLSGGRLRAKVRTDTIPGGPGQQMAALRSGGEGVPDLMLVSVTGLAPLEPAFGVLDFPFTLKDEAQAHALLDGRFGTALLNRLPEHGLVGTAWWESGMRQMTSSKAPLDSAAAFQGLRFRVIPEPFFSDVYGALGATPVPMLFKPVYEALKTGRADAQDNTEAQIIAGKFHEVQQWLTLTNHAYAAIVLVARAPFWQSLSADDQDLLRQAAQHAGQLQRRWVHEDTLRVRAKLQELGMKVAELPEAERQKLEALTRPVRERYAAKFDARLMALYEQELKAIQQKAR